MNETIVDIAKGDARATRIDPDALFGIGCESLLDDECACLDSTPTDDEILSFAAADLPAGPAVDAVCDAYEGAVRRCESCVPPSSIDDARDRLTRLFLDRILRLSETILRDTVGVTKANSARLKWALTRRETKLSRDPLRRFYAPRRMSTDGSGAQERRSTVRCRRRRARGRIISCRRRNSVSPTNSGKFSGGRRD